MRPVTIHQVLSADQAFGDAEFMIDGQEAKEVSLSLPTILEKEPGEMLIERMTRAVDHIGCVY